MSCNMSETPRGIRRDDSSQRAKRRSLGFFLALYFIAVAFVGLWLSGCETVSPSTPYERGQAATFAALAFADTTPEESKLQAVADDLTDFLDSNRVLTVEIVRNYSDRIAEKTNLSRAQVVIVTMALSRSLADNEQRAREFLRGVRDSLNLLNPAPIKLGMTQTERLFHPITKTALSELETPHTLPLQKKTRGT